MSVLKLKMVQSMHACRIARYYDMIHTTNTGLAILDFCLYGNNAYSKGVKRAVAVLDTYRTV